MCLNGSVQGCAQSHRMEWAICTGPVSEEKTEPFSVHMCGNARDETKL